MDKTITIPGQLEQYHNELKVLQEIEKKDRYILLTLAIAGFIGIYTLVGSSNQDLSSIDSLPAAAASSDQSQAYQYEAELTGL